VVPEKKNLVEQGGEKRKKGSLNEIKGAKDLSPEKSGGKRAET